MLDIPKGRLKPIRYYHTVNSIASALLRISIIGVTLDCYLVSESFNIVHEGSLYLLDPCGLR